MMDECEKSSEKAGLVPESVKATQDRPSVALQTKTGGDQKGNYNNKQGSNNYNNYQKGNQN